LQIGQPTIWCNLEIYGDRITTIGYTTAIRYRIGQFTIMARLAVMVEQSLDGILV
jgi:hypothetical protein